MTRPAPNLKIIIKSEPVGYENSNFQDFHISISNFLKFQKNPKQVTCPGWFDMELPTTINQKTTVNSKNIMANCKNPRMLGLYKLELKLKHEFWNFNLFLD